MDLDQDEEQDEDQDSALALDRMDSLNRELAGLTAGSPSLLRTLTKLRVFSKDLADHGSAEIRDFLMDRMQRQRLAIVVCAVVEC